MNIVLIGVNQRYINPTNSLLPSVLARAGKLDCFGPGFVTEDTLQRGINRFLEEKNCTPDIIVVNSQCLINTDAASFGKSLSRYSYVYNGGRITERFLDDIRNFCKTNRSIVACAITDLDPHVTPQKWIDRIADSASYYIGWGEDFLQSDDKYESFRNEGYIQQKIRKGHQTGLLNQFIKQQSERMINLGHFVAENEFFWGDLSTRRFDVAVPGSGYARRDLAKNALIKSGKCKIFQNRNKYVLKLLDRIGFKTYSNYYLVNLYNLLFQLELSRSKIAVTDGGGNDYPVRKFFEIPAAGALLVCWPAAGLEQLGYRNNDNCVFINSTNDIYDVVSGVKENVERYQTMADKARGHTLLHHSAAARSTQLKRSFESIVSRKFGGSGWVGGEYSVFS